MNINRSIDKLPQETSSTLFLGFNQDNQCFFRGTEYGFHIYNTNPYAERFKREFDAGIRIVELLGKSNIVALVGGGMNPKYSPTNVIIWDDYQNAAIAKLEYSSEVKSVRCRDQRIAVTLEKQVILYNFSDLQVISTYNTVQNNTGLCDMVSKDGNTILAMPGCKKGDLRIELIDQDKSLPISAHQGKLVAISLSPNGQLCATASDRGTLIRIWNTKDGSLNKELRRGINGSKILSLSFSGDSKSLCLSSDKGTIHIYSMVEGGNKTSNLSYIKGYLPDYFSSEWSQTCFSVPKLRKSICSFCSEDHITIITQDQKFYQYRFSKDKNHVQLIKAEKF